MWYYEDKFKLGLINKYNDILAIKKMIKTTKKSIVIYSYPQNCKYYYNYDYDYSYNNPRQKYMNFLMMKDLILNNTYKDNIGRYIDDINVINDIIFEPTITKIGDKEYNADFHFNGNIGLSILTKSISSEKITTIGYTNNVYITTLDVCKSIDDIYNYVVHLFNNESDEDVPDWVKDYNFGNDIEMKELIMRKKDEMNKLQNEIIKVEEKLNENNRYKSILCSSGEKLVEIVFEILEKVLDCDLSSFKDEKNEDFLIEKDGVVIIGEIKGVSSNVKNEHVSQLDVHYNKYKDEHEIINDNSICALLIINPFRTNDLSSRECINEQQISLAKRNKSLIIETKTLLKIFEMYNKGIVNTDNILEIFKNKAGLLLDTDLKKFE